MSNHIPCPHCGYDGLHDDACSDCAKEKAAGAVIDAAKSVIIGEDEGHHKNAKASYLRTLRRAIQNLAALEA